MVLWFQRSSLDHVYLRLSQSETVVRSLKLACFELRNNVSLDKGLVINYMRGGGGRGSTIWENRGSKTVCAPPFNMKLFLTPFPFHCQILLMTQEIEFDKIC